MGQESSRDKILRQPTRERVLSDDVESFTRVKPYTKDLEVSQNYPFDFEWRSLIHSSIESQQN
jgi:hypothetical protein